MKIRINMKTPDAVDHAINAAVCDLPEEDAESQRSLVRKTAAKWFRYGEYLTMELDTETGTCTVIPR